jgi:hypothetical protein
MAINTPSFTLQTKRGTRNTIVRGMDDVIDRFEEIANAASDIGPAWNDMGAIFQKRQETVFNTYNAGKWLPMAPSTLKEHASPLVQTGIMREGVNQRRPIWSSKQGAAFGAPKVDRRVMNVAVLNTVGHKRGTKQVPERVVVPRLTAKEKREMLGILREHIMSAMNGD